MIAPSVKIVYMSVPLVATTIAAITYTPSELTAITIAVSALVATIFTGIVNIITALRSERKIDHVALKIEDVSQKANVIGGHVNGAATVAAVTIESMQKQIEQLTRMLADERQRAAVLAQSKADVDVLKPIAEKVELTMPKDPARESTK